MTNTDATTPASKPEKTQPNTKTNPNTKKSESEPMPTAVVETRPGVGRGILIGAISAALVGGLALGGGAGALIASAVANHHGPGHTGQQQGPGGQHAPGQPPQVQPGQGEGDPGTD